MRKIILLAAIVIVAVGANAQDAKKGCDPKSCSPGNTKVEEAFVITQLREDVVALKSGWNANNKAVQIGDQVTAGSSDEESLKILATEVRNLSVMMKAETTDLSGNGAELAKNLRAQVNYLKSLDSSR